MTHLKKILLVDDSLSDIELAVHALKKTKLANEIVTFRFGGDALDYLHCQGEYANRTDGDPVVILLDVKMPRMDGLEVLRRLKSDEKLQLIPVVMLTSSSQESDLLQSYRLGVNAYVIKPVDFAQFTDAIRQLGVFWAAINVPPPVPPA